MPGKSRRNPENSGGQRGEEQKVFPTYALNVRAMLERQGWSQADLVRKLNLPYNTVNDWLNGRSTPGPEGFVALANVLNTTVDEILGRDPRTAERMRAICEHADYIKALATEVKPEQPAPPPPPGAQEPQDAGSDSSKRGARKDSRTRPRGR